MRLYLAGPMRGMPKLNHPEFSAKAKELRAAGDTVFSPAETGIPQSTEQTRAFIAGDLAWICAYAEGVVVLDGWADSPGARAEVATAFAIGIPVWRAVEFINHGTVAGHITSIPPMTAEQ